MLACAKSELTVQPDAFNTDPYVLNFANGTVDLRTGAMHPFTPADMLFYCLKTDYNPDARCPQFLRWLLTIFNHNKELVRYILRRLGTSLIGNNKAQEWFLGYGDGSNGKSTLMDLMLTLLEDYAMKARAKTFTTANHDTVPTDIADFFGKRFVTAAEIEMGSTLNESLMKEITGDKKMRARKMHRDFFEFDNTASFWLVTNHKPHVRDMTKGFWRRVRFIPFLYTIPTENPDFLEQVLLPEAEGILALLVKECVAEFSGGKVPIPAIVVQATDEYMHENDLVGQFLANECDERQGAFVFMNNLRHRFYHFCKQVHGETDEKMLASMLKKEMKRRGYKSRRSAGGYHVYDNLVLKSADDFDDPGDSDKVTQSYAKSVDHPKAKIAKIPDSDVTLRNYVTSNQLIEEQKRRNAEIDSMMDDPDTEIVIGPPVYQTRQEIRKDRSDRSDRS